MQPVWVLIDLLGSLVVHDDLAGAMHIAWTAASGRDILGKAFTDALADDFGNVSGLASQGLRFSDGFTCGRSQFGAADVFSSPVRPCSHQHEMQPRRR